MMDNENAWDKLLHIRTSGRDDTNSDTFRYPYEPTPYCVLERLAKSGLFSKKDRALDYGCGKGRVGFFLSYQAKIKSVGIEYDERILNRALENKSTAVSGDRVELVGVCAEEYSVPHDVNRCYFFNPFSVEILKKVMARILESYYEESREILLFFYYPSDEYMGYLMTVDELEFYDEITCTDLFDGNDRRERVMIFRLPDFSENV